MITTTGGGGQNALVAAVSVKILLLLLTSRATLRGARALINLGAYGAGRVGAGSTTTQVTVWGLMGTDAMGTVSEGSDVSETSLTNAAKTIAIARKGLRRDLSDQMRSLDPTGQLNPVVLAQDAFAGAMKCLTNMIAALSTGFSVQKGTTGVAFTHDLFKQAKAALIEALVPGPYMCVMHPNHFADWQSDLESAGGLTQWHPANMEMQQLRGEGFQGIYDNIEIWTTQGIPASGSDYVSMMFGMGAIGYAEQEIVYGPEAIIILQVGPIAVELVRQGTGANTRVIGHYNVGVAELEDARGVGLLAAA